MKTRAFGLSLLAAGICLVWTSMAHVQLVISNWTRAGGSNTLTWSKASTNYAFTVQYCRSLDDGIWLNAPWSSPWPTLLNKWSDTRALTNFNFYRVVQVTNAQRGALMANTSMGSYSQAIIAAMAAPYGVTPLYGVTLQRLTYETIDPLGGKVQATGLLCLPASSARPWRVLSYQHGTILQKSNAPSYSVTSSEGMIGILFASLGYVTVLPDYLGLGGSAGFHPYHHAVSEATASIDMLRAARNYCSTHSVVLTNRLFLMGYSQGGHSTMALLREMERYHSAEFSVTACAPMAGAYDLSGVTADDFLSGRVMPNPYYFAFLLAAYQNVYHLSNSLSNLLASPYNSTLPPLLDGLHSESAVNAAMANPPIQILSPTMVEGFRNNTLHPLRLALQDNSLCDWTPVAPMKLWHCLADQDVIYANSISATNRFWQRGVTVPIMDPNESFGHGACSQPSILAAKAWFDTFP